MADEKKLMEGKCPSCGAAVLFEDASSSVTCGCCDHVWRGTQLGLFGFGEEKSDASSKAETIVINIDNADSAYNYFEEYIAREDVWASFSANTDLSIPTLDSLVEKQLLKNSISPVVWKLQFNTIYIPLGKKLQALSENAKKFLKGYVELEDISDALEYYDTYATIIANIVATRVELLNKMVRAINNAKKYGISEEEFGKMKEGFNRIRAAIEPLKPISSYKEIVGFQAAEDAKQQKIAAKYAAENINAEEIYRQAVANYNAGGRSTKLLLFFQKIKAYKDSAEYFEKLNTYIKFGRNSFQFVRIKDSYFHFTKKETAFSVGAPQPEIPKKKKKGKKDEPAFTPNAFAVASGFKLYPIIGSEVSEIPTVEGISCILSHYGDNFYYISGDTSICRYDNSIKNPAACVTEILKAEKDAFRDASRKYTVIIRENYLFIRQKLKTSAISGGCLSKNKKVETVNNNNFSLLRLDMATGEIVTVLPEIVDVFDTTNEEIFFYSQVTKNEIGVDIENKYIYNYKRNKNAKILESDSDVRGIVDSKVIYQLWLPNQDNMSLYSLDLATRKKTLLETNIYEFFEIIDGKVYYLVGNNFSQSLFSISPDGTERVEILQNANGISNAVCKNGWLYIKKGVGYNTSLRKIRADGNKEVFICNAYRYTILTKDGYIYYLSTQNELCMVRTDGKKQQKLIDDVGEIISVDNDAIYFTRDEVGEFEYSKSLYKVSVDGHNLRKIAFDLDSIIPSDQTKDEIYFSKTELQTFSISTPVKKKYETSMMEFRVNQFVVYSKSQNITKIITEIGGPKKETIETQSGCLKKKSSSETIVTRVNNSMTIRQAGTAGVGAIAAQEKAAQEQELAKTPTTITGLLSSAIKKTLKK